MQKLCSLFQNAYFKFVFSIMISLKKARFSLVHSAWDVVLFYKALTIDDLFVYP